MDEMISDIWGLAFKEYRTPKCSRCHVIVKKDAPVCPHCGSKFLVDG